MTHPHWLIFVALVALVCACQSNIRSGDDGDGGTDPGVCNMPCPMGQICFASTCIPDVSCKSDDDCQNDSYCQDGHCIPYGLKPRGSNNPMCQRLVPAGLLSPQIFCEWSGPEAGDPFPNHKQVLSTPLVMDFDFDNHKNPENPTTKPSIVINTYDGTDGACGLGAGNDGSNFGIIRVLDGRTCKQQYVIPAHVNGATTPAIGDINGDRRPDILANSASGGLVALGYDQKQNKFVTLWESHEQNGAPSSPVKGLCEWTGPALADLDDDGKPEALLEGVVYDSTGKLLDGALGALGPPGVGQFPVVADVARDGVPRLVTPRMMLKWNKGQSKWDTEHMFQGSATEDFVAVADFGTVRGTTLDRTAFDGIAEIAVVSAGKTWILSKDGQVVFGPVSLPGSTGGGPPTIGDFDHDGRPEYATAGSNSYTVFDPDCVAGADEKLCPTRSQNGILWSQVSQDLSSNITGSSLFDFEGDGTAKAVYADECFARIYSGKTGEVLFSQEHSSCTWVEYPVVADVEGNFRSKLIVPSNVNCEITCPQVDPVFKGLRCQAPADCPNGLGCDAGYCRCTADAQCNVAAVGGGFVCRAAAAGVPGAGNTCQASHGGKRSGIRVFGDVADRWVSSRALWNQHPYSVTNIEDDGTLARTSKVLRNWDVKGLNNYRENVQGTLSPTAAPDLTSRADADAVCRQDGITLTAKLCNRGTAPVGDGVPVTFYEMDKPLCTGRTLQAIGPGTCGSASCKWAAGGPGEHHVLIIANDDGQGGHPITECDGDNDKATFVFRCGVISG